ncbi:MAG: selenocysteine-specific translation elongation factor [Acidobacteriales bacterium]|nr:selenocysteine-specific translation elongation factor [Terriglobales bacterium]
MPEKSIIVGTAGHIDHGKTSLVKALTGIDADRLEEEKRRGITIDLGFAHLEQEGYRFGFVDVPGHEKFVRNMLAGVGGIDLALLVVSAEEGIKPQTREHFEICRLLGIARGITVLTKSDMVDAETLGVVRREVEEFTRGSFLDAKNSAIVAASARSGEGIEALKRALAQAALSTQPKDAAALLRLPIDRVFTMKGFGTVITGTLVSGTIHKDDEVEVFPQRTRLRVRGVQVHGHPMEQAVAGERTALNLANIAKEDLRRGMTLAPPDTFRTTRRADVRLELLAGAKPLKDRADVHFHAYANEMVAEVVLNNAKQLEPGTKAFAQLRFPEPILLLPGDRFILRQFSPVVTIGGGVVLDAAPAGKGAAPEIREGFLRTMETGSAVEILIARVDRRHTEGLSLKDAVAETGWRQERIEAIAREAGEKMLRCGNILIATAHFDRAKAEVRRLIEEFHKNNPLVAGINKEELRERLGLWPEVFSALLERLVSANEIEVMHEQLRLAGRAIVMKDEEAEAKQIIEQAFLKAGLKVPALKDVLASLPVDKARATKIMTLLLRDRVLIKLADDLVFHKDALAGLRKMLADYKTSSGKNRIDVATFKDLAGITRKYAIPLLEHLDRERVTRRDGDVRVIL